MFNKIKKELKKILSSSILLLKQGKNFLSFISFKIIAEAISFVIPLIVAKIVSPELFGSFSLFKMILFFGTAVFIGPLMTPLNIESNKEYSKTKKSNKTFTSSLIYLLSSISIFLLIYFFFGKELITFTGLNYDRFKYIFLLAFLGLTIKSFLSTFFMSQNNKKAHIFVELVYNILLVASIALLYFLNIFNLYNIFFSFFIASIIILIISLFFIDFKRILPLSFSSSNFKIIRNFSLWVILGYTSSYFINWGDNLVLKYFVSLEEIGIYNFAYQIFKGFVMISFMINIYFTPFITKHIHNEKVLKDYLSNKRKKIMYVIIPLVILNEVLIGPFITYFFHEAYIPAITIFRILSPSIIIAFYLAFYFPVFNSGGNYKIAHLLIVLQIIFNLIFDIIFIPLFGIIGAAIGTSLAYIIYGIIYELIFRRIKIT